MYFVRINYYYYYYYYYYYSVDIRYHHFSIVFILNPLILSLLDFKFSIEHKTSVKMIQRITAKVSISPTINISQSAIHENVK